MNIKWTFEHLVTINVDDFQDESAHAESSLDCDDPYG